MRKTISLNFHAKFLFLFPLLAGLMFSFSVKAQDFNYSFAKDSVAWQELNTQTILNSTNSAWNLAYKIPIGFSFNYLGQTFDSITVERSGLLVFDGDRSFSFWGLVGYTDTQDTTGNFSVLGYQLNGTTGNRELVIQFKNVAAPQEPLGLVSYQVILRENNTIVFQMGDYQQSGIFAVTNSNPIALGLINQNMNTTNRALTLSGLPGAPSAMLINDTTPDITYLSGLPLSGIRYTFSPNF